MLRRKITPPLIYKSCRFYSVDSNSRITSEAINKVLANQGVSITQEKLDTLLKIKGVTFDLPFDSQTYPALLGLIGKPALLVYLQGTVNLKADDLKPVYIFLHTWQQVVNMWDQVIVFQED